MIPIKNNIQIGVKNNATRNFVGLFLKIIKKSVKHNIYRKIFKQLNLAEILSMLLLDYKNITRKRFFEKKHSCGFVFQNQPRCTFPCYKY